MEGKETRFGINASSLFAVITTAASCGAVNAMHDSFTPLGGMVPMVMMQLGEVVFGGVGTGLYGMLIFAMLAVFIAGLMIGRTPEYLGKKIESHEMKLVSIAILVTPILVLAGTAIAVLAGARQGRHRQPGRAWFSEILYALTSAGNNNGSAFAGPVGQHAFLQHAAGMSPCGWAASASSCRCWRLPARWPPRNACRDGRHHAHAWPAVRDAVDRHRAAGRPAQLRARPGARPGGRAPDALASPLNRKAKEKLI
jgi:hypothetical protein